MAHSLQVLRINLIAEVMPIYSQLLLYNVRSNRHYGSYCYLSNGRLTLLRYRSPNNQDTAEHVKVKVTSVLPNTIILINVNLLYCEGRQTVFHCINTSGFTDVSHNSECTADGKIAEVVSYLTHSRNHLAMEPKRSCSLSRPNRRHD